MFAASCERLSREFGVDVTPESVSGNGQDSIGSRSRIEKNRKKYDGTSQGEFGRLVDRLQASTDLRRADDVVDALMNFKKYNVEGPSLGIDRNVPPVLPPRRPTHAISSVGIAPLEGSRSPHFNRRSVSRSRVARSDSINQGGDTPPMVRKGQGTSISAQKLAQMERDRQGDYSSPISQYPQVTSRVRASTIGMEREWYEGRSAVRTHDRISTDSKMHATPTLYSHTKSQFSTPPYLPSSQTYSSTASPHSQRIDERHTPVLKQRTILASQNGPSHSPALSTSASNRLYDEFYSSSCSPISTATGTTGTTVVKAPCPIPSNALCARNRGDPVVPEDVLSSHILRALQGFEGSYFRLKGSGSTDSFCIACCCSLSLTLKGRVSRLLFIATYLHRLQQPLSGQDLIAEAFLDGIRRQVNEIVTVIASIRKDYPILSLCAIEGRVLPLERKVELLAVLKGPNKPPNKSMELVREIFYRYSSAMYDPFGDYIILGHLLDATLFKFSDLLKDWLAEGVLNVHNTEFMVKERAGHGGEEGETAMVRTWVKRFTLENDNVPPFISCIHGLPEKILNIGKCARLLGVEVCDEALTAHHSRVASLNLCNLYALDASKQMILDEEIGKVACEVCGAVLNRLLIRDKLKSHLSACRAVFLLQYEQFASYLFHEVNDMCRDVSTVSFSRTQQTASIAFLEAINTAHLHERFGFKLPVDAQATKSTGDTPFQSARSPRGKTAITVTPTYKAPRLSAIVINDAAVSMYQQLFHSLWPLYSVRLALVVARNELSFLSASVISMWPSSKVTLRMFQLALITAGDFFDTLIEHFMQGSSLAFDRLMAAIDSSSSVEECIKAHAQFLSAVSKLIFVEIRKGKKLNKDDSRAASSLLVLVNEAGSLLDEFWKWSEAINRESMIREGKERKKNEDIASISMRETREFEQFEERYRREDCENRMATAPRAEICSAYDKLMAAMDAFLIVVDDVAGGVKSHWNLLLHRMRVQSNAVQSIHSHHPLPLNQRRANGPSKWFKK